MHRKRTTKKEAKVDEGDSKDLDKKVKEKFAASALQDLTIPELKSFLKFRKAQVGGKKADLLFRTEAILKK